MDVEDEEDEEDEQEDDDVEEEDVEEKTGKHTLREPAQSKCTWTGHKSRFVWKCTRKMDGDISGHSVLLEPAQSKRTWTFHKSHFVWKFTRKMPDTPETTSIKHRA